MILPAVLLGFLIASLIGAAFHLLLGGNLGRLLLDVLLAWAGFWAGHFLAGQFVFTAGSLGQLHLAPAVTASLIFLALGHWLSLLPKNLSQN